MKNSTLLFRSLAIIILIAGSAHLASYASENSNYMSNDFNEDETTIVSDKTISEGINNETDYIIGKWKVEYNSKEFKGAVIYDLKKENNLFNAYTYEYQDEEGNGEKAENSKILVIKKFDGYKGKGIYKIEYEGESYQVKCTIDMVNENTFKLSYDYYGYGDVETWKRQ